MKTDDLIRLIAEDSAPAPSWAPRLLGALALALAGSAILFAALLDVRAGLMQSEVMRIVLMKLAVTVPVAVAGVMLAWRALQPGRDARGLRWLWAVPVVALSAALIWDMAQRGLDGAAARLFGVSPLGCTLDMALLSLPPLMALLWLCRRGAPTSPERAGLLAGFGAAGVGASVFALHCPNDSPLFVLAWYSLAALIIGALGRFLGRRYLAW